VGSTFQPAHVHSVAGRKQAPQQALMRPADVAAGAAAAPHCPPATAGMVPSPGYAWQDGERLCELLRPPAVHASTAGARAVGLSGVPHSAFAPAANLHACALFHLAACVCPAAC
jgi:hypothetical protein